jgi:hypothetical protein
LKLPRSLQPISWSAWQSKVCEHCSMIGARLGQRPRGQRLERSSEKDVVDAQQWGRHAEPMDGDRLGKGMSEASPCFPECVAQPSRELAIWATGGGGVEIADDYGRLAFAADKPDQSTDLSIANAARPPADTNRREAQARMQLERCLQVNVEHDNGVAIQPQASRLTDVSMLAELEGFNSLERPSTEEASASVAFVWTYVEIRPALPEPLDSLRGKLRPHLLERYNVRLLALD